jgi:tetratricopeptide (TPR) repeat protein
VTRRKATPPQEALPSRKPGNPRAAPPVVEATQAVPREIWTSGWVTFLLALAVRLAHVWAMRHTPYFTLPMGDSAGYDLWAQGLAAGRSGSSGPFYQSPLYPYLLGLVYSLFGRDLVLLRVLQAVLGACGCAITALAGARLFGRTAGLSTGLFLALYAPAIFYDGLIQKANLDFLLVAILVAMLAFVRAGAPPHYDALLGVALGLLCLNRENALLLVPLFVAWAWRRERPSRRAPLFLVLGVALVLTPVALRNKLVGGELELTTSQSGPNFYIGNNPAASGSYEPLRPGRGSPEFERTDATQLAEAAAGRKLDAGEVSAYWRERAFRWIREHPSRWLALLATKLRLTWSALEVMDTEDLASHADHSPVLRLTSSLFHFGILAPLALLGLWATWMRRNELWIFYGLLAIYTLSLGLFYVLGRYRYPLVPVLAVFLGAGVVHLRAGLAARDGKRLAGAVALLATFAVLCNWPAAATSTLKARTQANLARTLAENGRPEEAIRSYRSSLALEPDAPRTLVALGSLLAQQARYSEAQSALERALALDAQLPEVHNALGILAAARGETERAIETFATAVRLRGDDADFNFNLATALAVSGKPQQAVGYFERAVALNPSDFKSRNNLGIALAQSGRLAEAAAQFRAALELEPQSAEARQNLERAEAALRTP